MVERFDCAPFHRRDFLKGLQFFGGLPSKGESGTLRLLPFFLFTLHVLVHICVCRDIHILARTHACTRRGQRSTLGALFQSPSTLFLETGSLAEPGAHWWAGQAGWCVLTCSCLCCLRAWIQRCTAPYLAFYLGAGDLNSGLMLARLTFLLTEPSPQLPSCFGSLVMWWVAWLYPANLFFYSRPQSDRTYWFRVETTTMLR